MANCPDKPGKVNHVGTEESAEVDLQSNVLGNLESDEIELCVLEESELVSKVAL